MKELSAFTIKVNPYLSPGQYVWSEPNEVVIDPVMLEAIKRLIGGTYKGQYKEVSFALPPSSDPEENPRP